MNALIQFDKARLEKAIIGLDEAGRGAFAGPLAVAAVYLDDKAYDFLEAQEISEKVKDSKLMPAEDREEVFLHIKQWAHDDIIKYRLYMASVEEIESLNITGATIEAMKANIKSLLQELPASCYPTGASKCDLFGQADPIKILTDGKPFKNLGFFHEAHVSGDNKSFAIGLASIIAKTSRDQYMIKIDELYPDYGFKQHKGYGTEEHTNALKLHGSTPLHRAKFIRNIQNASKEEDFLFGKTDLFV